MSTAPGGLQLAEGLTLPIEAVTQTVGILAKRGAGKTYTAAVIVEELVAAGLPVVVADPLGVWWGLRSSADGTGDGLPVVIFGGDHGDLPLTVDTAELIADVIVDQRISAVLDLSALSKGAARRFMRVLAERLYHRNRDPLHLVLDEADMFAPQSGGGRGGGDPEVARLLGAIEDLVRRGRARGLGCTLITQRPAVLHKDVLTQVEVLIVLQMTGPRDVAAIDEWVRLHAEEQQARQVKADLPVLPVGTAWVWSPGWLQVLQKIQVRRRRTFDSSATPKVGQERIQPQRVTAVDLAELGEMMRQISEKAADTDPAALQARVRELQRQLRNRPEPERVEVPTVSAEVIAELRTALEKLQDLGEWLNTIGQTVSAQLAAVPQAQGIAPPAAPLRRAGPDPAPAAPPNDAPAVAHTDRQLRVLGDAVDEAGRVLRGGGQPAGLRAGARRMLELLARYHPMRMSRAQLATLAGMAATGGTFGTYFSVLRRAGYLRESDGLVEATAAGRIAAGLPEVGEATPMTPQELREIWRRALRAGARLMLDHLLSAYPQPVTRAQLAAAAGLEISGGTFGSYLSTLRRNGLVTVAGDRVRASEVFFLAAEDGVVAGGR